VGGWRDLAEYAEARYIKHDGFPPVICGSWRSIFTLDSVVGGLPSVKGKMTFAVVAVHEAVRYPAAAAAGSARKFFTAYQSRCRLLLKSAACGVCGKITN
jgi:hypothetical protein